MNSRLEMTVAESCGCRAPGVREAWSYVTFLKLGLKLRLGLGLDLGLGFD